MRGIRPIFPALVPGAVLQGAALLAAACGALLLQGCATPALGGGPDTEVYSGTELPPPEKADITAESRPYFLGPFDRIQITVFGIEELTRPEVTINEAGIMNYPPVGLVKVSGQTADDVSRFLAQRLKMIGVREPQVVVALKDAISQTYTIDGAIAKPGVFPVIGRMSLMKAVAASGGKTDVANLRHIVVFRTVKDQRLAALYDLKAVRNGAYPDPEIFPNDTILVGENEALRFFRNFSTAIGALTQPLIVVTALRR